MTDKELLELAAKAAGIDVKWDTEYQCFLQDGTRHEWDALTDDGDALRLAVKLRIHIRHFPNDVEAQFERGYWREDDGSDPYAATRRAIVRAAAILAATPAKEPR